MNRLLHGAVLAAATALGACNRAEPPAPAPIAAPAELGTVRQAVGAEVSLLFPEGYIGTVGANPQQADVISKFGTLNVVRAGFFQDDSDGDGLFTLQGNDVPGTVKLFFANGTSIAFASSLTWREAGGSTINGFGFIPADCAADIPFPSPYAGSIKCVNTAAKSNVVFKNYTTSSGFLPYTDGENRQGNAASVQTMLDDLNAVLTSAPKPTVVSLTSASVQEGTSIVYTVTLSAGTTFPRSFPFAFSGTATPVSDYLANAVFSGGVVDNGDGTLTVPGTGVTSFTVTVSTVNDSVHEPSENLKLTVGDQSGTATITDDDPALSVTPTATTLAYAQGAAATIVDPGVVVAGGTNANTSATVTVKKGTSTLAEDVLACPAAVVIAPRTCNVAAGVLTISGSGTNAEYQAALRLVTYADSVATNALDTGLRTATFSVTDTTPTTATGTRAIQPQAQATVTVTPTASTVNYGVPTTFTATLGPSASTGTIQWKVDSVNEGTPVTVASGAGTLSNLSLLPGTYTISAVYGGDTERLGATGSTTFTVAQLGNGVGPCTATNQVAVCVSDACNTTTNTCGGPVNTTCTNANQCAGNVCDGGKCGIANGNGTCTVATAAVCQSGLCSTNSGTCIAAGTCWVDADCASTSFCHRSTGLCTTDLGAGISMPGDGLHSATCNAPDALAVCTTGLCNAVANTCGKANGQSCSAANQCASNTCSSGTCVPAGGCYADVDCPAAQHCNRNALTCTADLANGAAIPNDGLHTGTCNATNAAAACTSGQCNATTNTCAGPNTSTSCTLANQCVTNVCGSNGKCGTTSGGSTAPGGCTSGTASTVCQSSTCSVNGANCIPASNGCYVDADCAAAKHCNQTTLTCVDDKANGVAIPNDGIRNGTCSGTGSTAACVSGQCNTVTNTCAGPNTTTTCANANECVTNVCDATNGKCGRTDGTGPCFGAASSCQSGVCNATADGSTSACVPAGTGKCWVDADCPATDYCARNVFTCRPKETNGTALPADTLHNACATGNVNAACASGRCNPTTNTCGGPNVTTSCTNANQCITNACGTNGKCGRAEGEAGCTAGTAATVCQSATCSTNTGTCITAGTCWADDDCAANQHCNRNTGACTADKANGVAIPTDGLHTGVCNTSNASATCESTGCNATTNTCAGPNVTTSCTGANECVTNACGSNGKCGLANGQLAPGANGCSGTNSGVCQSSTCSVNGTHCIPAANGCYVDGDCPAAKHCDRNALTCVDDKANGVAIPNDGLHTGVCNDANALAACQSGKCNAVTNTCAGPNVTTTCANANQCVTNVCGSNGKCGYADGQAGCTTATASTCQSNVCTASGVCLPAGKCWVDSDCPATDYCARSENTCRPKEKAGTPVPNDGLHDGGCTDANAQATCASGKCNAATKTCGEVNETTCVQASQCTSNVCFGDGACGVPSNSGCTANAECRSGACVDGLCATPDSEVRGSGGLRCAVTTTSAASDETSPAWLFGLALTLAVSRRRKAARTSTTTNAQR